MLGAPFILEALTPPSLWDQQKCPSVHEWIKKSLHMLWNSDQHKKPAPAICYSVDGSTEYYCKSRKLNTDSQAL